MIAYRDFAPRQLSAAGFLQPAEHEPLKETLARANDWVREHGIDVLNVETVVLPNLWSPHSEGTTDPNRVLQPGFAEAWNQFIRVWYRVSPA
jgi:hypothetical protein